MTTKQLMVANVGVGFFLLYAPLVGYFDRTRKGVGLRTLTGVIQLADIPGRL